MPRKLVLVPVFRKYFLAYISVSSADQIMASFLALCIFIVLSLAPCATECATLSVVPNHVVYITSLNSYSLAPVYTVTVAQPGDNDLLHPSVEERVSLGASYTIKWQSPAGDFISMELDADNARSFGGME